MALINLTPHQVVVRLADGGDVIFSPSGRVARCAVSQETVGEANGIPIVRSVFGAVEGLPEAQDGTIYIVSSLVAQAVAGREDVVAPDTGPTAVRDEGGRIVAVTRFQKF